MKKHKHCKWCGDAGIEIVKEFENLNFTNKICFTWQSRPQFKSTIYLKDLPKLPETEVNVNATQAYFDVVDWLNNGSKKPNLMRKALINYFMIHCLI